MMRRLTKVSALAALAALVLAADHSDNACRAFCHAGCGRETGPWLYARELRPSPGV